MGPPILSSADEFLECQPSEKIFRPWVELFLPQSDAVGPVLEDVHFAGHACFPESLRVEESVLDIHGRVVPSVEKKGRWSFLRNVTLVGKEFEEGWIGVFAEQIFAGSFMSEFQHGDDWVTQDGQVGSGAFAFDGIRGIGGTGIEVGGEGRCEMASGAGAHDADARGIDFPIGGLGPHHSKSAAGVLKHDGVAVALGAESILEDEGCDAVFREPFGVPPAFVRGERSIAAAGEDDDGGSGGVFWVGEEGSEGRRVIIAFGEGAWRWTGPQRDGGIRSGERGGEKP